MNLFEGLGPIIIYTIVLLLWTCKHIIVCRSYTITAFILSMYTITAISAVLFYYLYSSRVGYVNITLFGFIKWMCIFIVCMLPIISFDRLLIKQYTVRYGIINTIGVVAFFTGIIPIIELLPRIVDVFSNFSNFLLSASDIHDSDVKELGLSFIGETCMRVDRWLYDFSFVVLIPLYQNKNRYKFAFYGFCSVILAKHFPNILQVSRGGLLILLMNTICVLLIYRFCLSKKNIKRIYMSAACLILSIVLLFAGITLSRQSDYDVKLGDYSLDYFLLKYAGEPPLNYNEWAENAKSTLDGNLTLFAFKRIIGSDVENIDREFYYSSESKMGIPLNIFYTYIGDFVLDVGYPISLIIFSIISYLLINILRRRSRFLSLSDLFILYIYIHTIAFGYNGYIYTGSGSQLLIIDLIIYFILRLCKT